MNVGMNNKKISNFCHENSHGYPVEVISGVNADEIYLSATNHGQYDLFLIVKVVDGIRTWWNINSVSYFTFKDQENEKT